MVYACSCFNISIHVFKKFQNFEDIPSDHQQCTELNQIKEIRVLYGGYFLVELGFGVAIERPELVHKSTMDSPFQQWESVSCFNCAKQCYLQIKDSYSNQYILLHNEMVDHPNIELSRQNCCFYSPAFHISINVPEKKCKNDRSVGILDSHNQLQLSKIQQQLGEYQKKETKSMMDRITQYEIREKEKLWRTLEIAQRECEYLVGKVCELRHNEINSLVLVDSHKEVESVKDETNMSTKQAECRQISPTENTISAVVPSKLRKVIVPPESPTNEIVEVDEMTPLDLVNSKIDEHSLNNDLFSENEEGTSHKNWDAEKKNQSFVVPPSCGYGDIALRSLQLGRSLYAKYNKTQQVNDRLIDSSKMTTFQKKQQLHYQPNKQHGVGTVSSNFTDDFSKELLKDTHPIRQSSVLNDQRQQSIVFPLEDDDKIWKSIRESESDSEDDGTPFQEAQLDTSKQHFFEARVYGSSLPIQVPQMTVNSISKGYATSWSAEHPMMT